MLVPIALAPTDTRRPGNFLDTPAHMRYRKGPRRVALAGPRASARGRAPTSQARTRALSVPGTAPEPTGIFRSRPSAAHE